MGNYGGCQWLMGELSKSNKVASFKLKCGRKSIILPRMKNKLMNVSFLVFLGALTILFAVVAWPFAKAAFLAITLTIIIFPIYRAILKRLRNLRYLSAILTTVLTGALVIFPMVVISAIFITKLGHFVQGLSVDLGSGSLKESLTPFLTTIHDWVFNIVGSAPSVDELMTSLINSLKNVGKEIYEFSPHVISTTASIVINFFLMLLFVVVFLAEGGRLNNWILETSPLSTSHWKEIARNVRITITSSILAIFVIAFVQGSLLALGFWAAGFQNVYGWWLVAIFMSLIPVIGSPACYITAAVVLFTQGNNHGGVLFLIYGFGFISVIDNFIRPILVRGGVPMHPVLIFVALVGAVRFFGPIGLLVGPVLLSVFLSAINIYRREYALRSAQS